MNLDKRRTGMGEFQQSIYKSILDGDQVSTKQLVHQAIESGVAPASILQDGMIAAMAEVGRLYEAGEYYVPEMLISARAMQTGLAILKPFLQETNVSSTGKVVIGTVKGDLHDIGKNLVAMMLEGAGFEVIDLGSDVTPEKFVEAVKREKPDVIAMSALLTTTMLNMNTTLEALREAGIRDSVKVMIGGAPVTDEYAEQIAADGFADDASKAVSMAKKLIKQ
jgi:5-methyltetrahydrofolate--homocysteine methyltransferase